MGLTCLKRASSDQRTIVHLFICDFIRLLRSDLYFKDEDK